MVNFSPLAAEIVSLVWGTPGNFNGFRVLAALLHGTLIVGISQTASLNRGCHLYLAGRPSRWALAHISSCCCIILMLYVLFVWKAVQKCISIHAMIPRWYHFSCRWAAVMTSGLHTLPISHSNCMRMWNKNTGSRLDTVARWDLCCWTGKLHQVWRIGFSGFCLLTFC